MSATAVGIGILGFGGFAMFAAKQFAQVPGAALRCIAGTRREASLACAARFGLADVERAEVLFAMPDVQLVYIATRPFLHYEQARARIDVENLYAPSERALRARHKAYEAYQRITLTSPPATKMTVYGDLLRAMLADQLAFIAEPSHARVITEDNGRESLRMSVRATQLATSS